MDVAQTVVVAAVMAVLLAVGSTGQQQVIHRPPIAYESFEFSLADMPDVNCIHFFRFTKSQIAELLVHFRIDTINFRFRNAPSPELALCIVLQRLSHPNRYKDNLHRFGRSREYQSAVFTDTIYHLVQRYHLVLEWDESRLTPPFLTSLARSVEEHSGGRVRGVFGWVDGTQRPICRPGEHQEVFYSGYKKAHTLKFQAIVTPDGMISHLAGPFEGKLGDWSAWQQSGVVEQIRQVNDGLPAGEGLLVYGDPAYTASYGVMGPFLRRLNRPLTEGEREFNKFMGEMRRSVECGFGKVVNNFSYISYRNGLKIGLTAVGACYMVAVLLTNAHTCFNGSQVSDDFGLAPPALSVYLQNPA
jgi:hypothetical protein